MTKQQTKTSSSPGMFQEVESYLYNLLPAPSLMAFTDLEVLSYIYECVKYYAFENASSQGSGTFKKGKLAQIEPNRPAMPAYVLRRIVYFMLGQFTSLAFLQKIDNLGINPSRLFDLFTMFVSSQISWFSVISYFSSPYIVNGLVGPMILSTVRGYANRDEVSSVVKYSYKALENTKFYYRGEKRTVLELMVQSLGRRLNGMIILEPLKVVRFLVRMMRAGANQARTKEDANREIEMNYNVKEVDDVVVIEEKQHKEVMDKSGVLIVDI